MYRLLRKQHFSPSLYCLSLATYLTRPQSSTSAAKPLKTLSTIFSLYRKNKRLTAVTAHDFITGTYAEDSSADIVLIGDSLAMVALGHVLTNQVKFDEFLYLARAVSRAVSLKFLIADLPFGTYEDSVSHGVKSAIEVMSTCPNVQAIKIEGGKEHLDLFKRLDSIGIATVAHCGLTPQRYHYLGGYKVQGSKTEAAQELLDTCLTMQNEGKAKMLVLECVPESVARMITEELDIPTIGIGAGVHTSGQILVQGDMLGMHRGRLGKFVRQYADLYESAVGGINQYCEDVRQTQFPGEKESYHKKEE